MRLLQSLKLEPIPLFAVRSKALEARHCFAVRSKAPETPTLVGRESPTSVKVISATQPRP